MTNSASTLVVTPFDLQTAFEQQCRAAHTIHVASAWATPGAAVQALCDARRSGTRVHAVIGTHFAATHPEALDSLLAATIDLRVARASSDGVFHPKMTLFESKSGATVLLGSANLTKSAFCANAEICVLLSSISSALRSELLAQWTLWYDDARKVSPPWLEEYRRLFKRCRALRRKLADADAKVVEAEPETSPAGAPADGTADRARTFPWIFSASWDAFEREVERSAFAWYGKRFDPLSTGPNSYFTTLRLVKPLLQRLPEKDTEDFGQLVGAKGTETDTGWLGRLTRTNAGIQLLQHDRGLRRRTAEILREVIEATTPLAADVASGKLFEFMLPYHGIGHGVVTRFLAIARPELYFSVNTQSVKGLRRLFGGTEAALKQAHGYISLARKVRNAPWWNAAAPKSVRARRLWASRVALLDILAYRPKDAR
ncbi:hypothetical protein BH11PLA1_BH11PLA1_18460 [soil metagenome]